jgi:hypothetical protein
VVIVSVVKRNALSHAYVVDQDAHRSDFGREPQGRRCSRGAPQVSGGWDNRADQVTGFSDQFLESILAPGDRHHPDARLGEGQCNGASDAIARARDQSRRS